ncbi:unnamed protein product [Ectocarpus sp. 12 AP-2014]
MNVSRGLFSTEVRLCPLSSSSSRTSWKWSIASSPSSPLPSAPTLAMPIPPAAAPLKPFLRRSSLSSPAEPVRWRGSALLPVATPPANVGEPRLSLHLPCMVRRVADDDDDDDDEDCRCCSCRSAEALAAVAVERRAAGAMPGPAGVAGPASAPAGGKGFRSMRGTLSPV